VRREEAIARRDQVAHLVGTDIDGDAVDARVGEAEGGGDVVTAAARLGQHHDVLAASDTTSNSPPARKNGRRRRELNLECACIEISSVLGMDFQPVLGDAVRFLPLIRRQYCGEIVGGYYNCCALQLANGSTVVQA